MMSGASSIIRLSELVRTTNNMLDSEMRMHMVTRFQLDFEWLLSTFGEEGFYQFVAGRMRNYMIHIMKD